MNPLYPQGKNSQRAGEQHRNNVDRYFHVMSQGWYVYTREGVRGPFIDKPRAETFIKGLCNPHMDDNDPSEAWRL